MKSANLPALLLLAAVAAGCNQKPDEAGNPATNTVSANDNAAQNSNAWVASNLSNLATSTKNLATNAWESTKETGTDVWQKANQIFGSVGPTNELSTNYFGYDYAMKDAFVSEAKTNLDALDQQSAKLYSEVTNATGSAKSDLQEQLNAIDGRRAELGKGYDQILNATQDNWNDAKAAFVKSFYDLKATLKATEDAIASKM